MGSVLIQNIVTSRHRSNNNIFDNNNNTTTNSDNNNNNNCICNKNFGYKILSNNKINSNNTSSILTSDKNSSKKNNSHYSNCKHNKDFNCQQQEPKKQLSSGSSQSNYFLNKSSVNEQYNNNSEINNYLYSDKKPINNNCNCTNNNNNNNNNISNSSDNNLKYCKNIIHSGDCDYNKNEIINNQLYDINNNNIFGVVVAETALNYFKYEENMASSTAAPIEKREHLYKILVIGELGAGKTSFIKRYVHQFFSQNYRATIGVDFALKVLNWDQQTIIRLQLWDIAGQERFGNMTRVYYKEAVGAFIVFDVTRSATFDAVVKWKQDLDSKVQLPNGKPIPCILLANKCDQQKQGLVNTPAKMDEYVKENGFAGWYETSAKENVNIEEAARSLVNKILLNDTLINSSESTDSEKFGLNDRGNQTNKKNCAC